MMTVMQWLAALAIVLGSLGAAVAQDTGSKSPGGPTILVPNPSSVAEPVSGGGPAPDVAAGPGHPRQPTILSSAFSDYGWLPLKYAPNAAKMIRSMRPRRHWPGRLRPPERFPSPSS
jgi:hypothetical protein